MFFAKNRLVTAIDISDGSVKLVAILSDKSGKSLYALDSAELTSDKDEEIVKTIHSLVLKNKAVKSHFYANFPRHLVTIRNVRLPAANEQEVKNMAELQAIKYLPYAREEMVVAHKIIEITKDGYTDIMLILAQNKAVDRYVDIFAKAGISVENMALSTEGLFNWYSRLKINDSQAVAAMDLDRRHTHIQIIQDKKILFSRSVLFDALVSESDRHLLLREVNLSFDSFLKERGERVAQVILSGGEDYAKDYSKFLSDNLLISCEYAGQLQKVKTGETAGKFLAQLKKSSFTCLLGIALTPDRLAVNLLPHAIIEKRRENAIRSELVKTTVLLLAVTVTAFGIIKVNIDNKRAYLKKIEDTLKEIEPEVERLSNLKENIELVQSQLALDGSAIDILREIYSILPGDVSLTLFEFEDKARVLLRGTTLELSRVFALLPLLEKSPYFENVKINFATKRPYKNREYADFEIVCTLR